MPRNDVPDDVAAIRAELDSFLNATDADGRVIGNATHGVYAFFDYDGEPIYVGQTKEKLRTRIRRHLTNQRTDAVAMNVLDPFEVAEVEMWPLFELEDGDHSAARVTEILNSAEYTVFQQVLSDSSFGAVLNEKEVTEAEPIELPPSHRARIVPDGVYEHRQHPDVRIARRANTIAALARVISERAVSKGLRRTLHTQARRLERLAGERFTEVVGGEPEDEGDDEQEE